MMREYTTIIFDLGGVIINLKKQNCIDAFKALGYDSVDKMLSEYRQDGEFLALEEGRVSPEEWRNIVRRSISSPVTDEQIDAAFNEFLVDIPVEKLRMLRTLKSKYRIAMLSNTNKVMFESKIPELFKIEGLTIEDYFDDFFLRHYLLTILKLMLMLQQSWDFKQCVLNLIPIFRINYYSDENNIGSNRQPS